MPPKRQPRRSAVRDREATRRRILGAVGQLLAAEGFRALGINAIARRARADKTLIYRYFGGLPQLLAAYAEEGDFWWKVEDLIGPHLPPPADDTLAGWIALVFRRHVAALKARPETLEIMAWETIERNELTAALADVREKRSLTVMKTLTDRFPVPSGLDVAAAGALFGAATNYLLIRGRATRVFQGVDLGTRRGWDRLLGTIERMTTALTGQ
ncbi:MAG TPA: TetR/AcrR family transcriptional regulator [Candidatus Binataceae bacterium]|nr:TetR/AcrR family transcriptional regulator [Candidatus Binataceae bacterium]